MRTQGSDRVAVCLYRQAFRFGNCRPFKITQWQTSAKPSLEVVVPLSKVLNRGSEWLKINSFHEADLSVRAFTRIRRPVRLGSHSPKVAVFLRLVAYRGEAIIEQLAWDATPLALARWVSQLQVAVGPIVGEVSPVVELVEDIVFDFYMEDISRHVWGATVDGQEAKT